MQPFVQTDARESPKTYCPDWFLEFESLFMTAVSRTIRMLAFHFLRKAAEGMMQEMELKLELSAAGASSLLEKNPFGQSPTILRQTSVYFDTVEGDLSKRGLSLRIRQCGEESIERYPEATVLNLGCGLDSRIFRIDPGPGVRWFELDFPDAFA